MLLRTQQPFTPLSPAHSLHRCYLFINISSHRRYPSFILTSLPKMPLMPPSLSSQVLLRLLVIIPLLHSLSPSSCVTADVTVTYQLTMQTYDDASCTNSSTYPTASITSLPVGLCQTAPPQLSAADYSTYSLSCGFLGGMPFYNLKLFSYLPSYDLCSSSSGPSVYWSLQGFDNINVINHTQASCLPNAVALLYEAGNLTYYTRYSTWACLAVNTTTPNGANTAVDSPSVFSMQALIAVVIGVMAAQW